MFLLVSFFVFFWEKKNLTTNSVEDTANSKCTEFNNSSSFAKAIDTAIFTDI